MSAKSALLIIDMVNEIVHPEGKFAGGGWAAEVERRDVLTGIAAAVSTAQAAGIPVIHVALGFSPSYQEWPAGSPVLGGARNYQALALGSWGAAIHDTLKPTDDDAVVVKHRISPFHGTSLELRLRALDVERLYLAGVSTDLAVLSAARDAHDRDFAVTVLADCCAAASEQVHKAALDLLASTTVVAGGAEALAAG